MRVSPLIAAALFSVAACSAGDDTQPGGNASAERPESAAFVVGAEEETDTVRTELYQAPADFPVRFSTYVPEDMHAETASSNGGGEAVRFVPDSEAVRDRNAYVNVFVHPEGSTTRDAEAFAEAFAASAGIPVGGGEKPPQPDFPRRYSWSIAEFDFDTSTREGERVLGTIAVGEHDGRAFHVVLQYPADLGDHFLPRAQLIGEELRWDGEVDSS